MMLVMSGISVFAQCNYNEVNEPIVSPTTVMLTAGGGHMERDGRNLKLDGRELSDAEVRGLVGPENYETYLSAKNRSQQVVSSRAC